MNNFVLRNMTIAGGPGLQSVDLGVLDGIFSIYVDATGLESIDCSGILIFPGFIDVHCHGAVGVDVNDAEVEDLLRVAAFLAGQGVTAWMPTLVPDSDENYLRVIAAIDELMVQQQGQPVAQAVGVHYEGVFANTTMCGALRPQYFKSSGQWSGVGSQYQLHRPAREQGRNVDAAGRHVPSGTGALGSGAAGLPRLKTGVHMTTLAPEIEGGIELIEELIAAGWIVSIGHTKADAETLDRAFAAGARHMTHFFNAMTGVHHRDIGVAGWGLANPDVTFDIIADGVHVDPRMLAVACRAKSPDKVSLISDSVAPTGLGDGDYELWGETISVVDGRTQNQRGSIAGSVSTMLDGLRMMKGLGFSDDEVARMTSSNPSRLLGLDDRGLIEAGKRADLVALDARGEIAFTIIGGNTVPG